MSIRDGKINVCAMLAAIGFTINITWCTLIGHTSGFAAALLSFNIPVNPRAFFLLGILLLSIVFLLLPQWLREREGTLWPIMALLASFGTLLFAIAPNQTFMPATFLSIGGLLICGIGYLWLSACFIMFTARTQTFTCLAICIATSLIVEPFLVTCIENVLPLLAQVILVVSMPIMSALLFQGARHTVLVQSDDQKHLAFGIPLDSRNTLLNNRRNVLTLVITSALLLATVRSLSFVGLWGDGHIAAPSAALSIVLWLIYSAVLGLFTYVAIILVKNLPPHLRFQPPFLIVILTLCVSLILAYDASVNPAIIDMLTRLNDSFSHLLFWSLVTTLLFITYIPSYRVIGIATSLYAVASVIWVLFLSNTGSVTNLVVIVVIYFLSLVIMLFGLGRRDKQTVDHHKQSTAVEADITRANEGSYAGLITHAIEERCTEVAEAYGLSPRETEVLNLLVQGRTRVYIQEELVLAENTVKTHITHIYTKLGVKDRKEMIDLMLDDQAGHNETE